MEAIARAVRSSDNPFGGIQLVMCGDFYQLPPVSKGAAVKLCLQAESWKRCVTALFELKRVFRQSDMRFITALNEVRRGQYSAGTFVSLIGCA